MRRRPEPELTDLPDEVAAYAAADFAEVNARFVGRVVGLAGHARTLLDVGCGPGDITIAIARALPGCRVTGVDGSEPMLAIARERAAGVANVDFVIADAKALPAALGTFDAIVSNSLLHHLPDPAGFWTSLRRVGRAGATVLIRDLLRPGDEAAARRIVYDAAGDQSPLLREEFYRSLLAAFTIDEVREQLDAAGLASLRVECASERHVDAWGTLPIFVEH